MGVYFSFFSCGLMFPLDPDLVTILKFYELPFCRYTPASIGCMVSFLPLITLMKISFSLDLFQALFNIHVLTSNRFMSMGTRACKKLVEDLPHEIRKWQ